MEPTFSSEEAPTSASDTPPSATPPPEEGRAAEPEESAAAATPERPEDREDEEEPSSPPKDEETGSPGDDPLSALAERASRGRLSPGDEEEATRLVREALGSGREGLVRAVEQLPRLPWIIGVNGVTAAWPEMKPAVRNRLLASLARVDSDAARRVRLSLARGLFKLEPAVASKLAVGVAKEIRDKETGAVAPKNAQVFANVLIGRAKPWIGQLPLGDLKPADSDLLVHCALYAVFLLPHTPVTQLGVLKWAAAGGKLARLHKGLLEVIVKGLNRWSGKWQGVLRREVEGLPEEILSSLKPEQPAAPEESREERRGGRDRGRNRERSADEDVPPPHNESADGGEPDPEEEAASTEHADERDEDADADSQAGEPEPSAPKPRPVYESKTIPRERERERDPRDRERDRKPGGAFNLHESLRQIDTYVASLRAELSTAQGKLRQREDDSRKSRKPERGSAPIIPGEPSAEELARLNVQLEARNLELTQQIEELRGDSEDRAAAAEIATGQPVADEDKRLRQLLTLKLQESYDDFLALESESPDIVAPKHYRTVLGHVFQVLAAESIFTAAPPVD